MQLYKSDRVKKKTLKDNLKIKFEATSSLVSYFGENFCYNCQGFIQNPGHKFRMLNSILCATELILISNGVAISLCTYNISLLQVQLMP